jgi:hypothetical protein
MTNHEATGANRWADPDGFEVEPPRVRYRIRDSAGEVVERLTSIAWDSGRKRYYHSLAPHDQHFADAIVELIQQACGYFWAGEAEYAPLEGAAEARVSDDEVRARIDRLERGENVREAERTSKRYYPLSELPWEQQRALVERIDELKGRWAFEILGEVEAPEAARRAS